MERLILFVDILRIAIRPCSIAPLTGTVAADVLHIHVIDICMVLQSVQENISHYRISRLLGYRLNEVSLYTNKSSQLLNYY